MVYSVSKKKKIKVFSVYRGGFCNLVLTAGLHFSGAPSPATVPYPRSAKIGGFDIENIEYLGIECITVYDQRITAVLFL
jgi:hypothetical protein